MPSSPPSDHQAQAGMSEPKRIRIEYEIPPLRAIYATWFEEDPEATDEGIREWYTTTNPTHRIRKIERNIGLTQAITRQHHED